MTADRPLHVLAGVVALAGVALRLAGFGRHAFWNDEAWVAISTRVEGLGQFLLSLAVTPILWAAALRLLDLLPAPPETALRLLPLAFATATLWLAWQLGRRLTGHSLGGLLALALVALDPTSVAWSKQLKPYTTEAALALLAFLAADAVARRGRPADVTGLALVLTLGTTLSNAQLLLAPPLLAVLAASALLRGDRVALRRIALATAVVGLWDLAWFALLVHPWLTPALRDYWRGHYAPLTGTAALAAFVRASFSRLLAPGLGPHGLWLALGGLTVLLATPVARWTALALLLLAVELVALSGAGSFPLSAEKTALFFSTPLLVTTGAAIAHVAVRLWTVPPLRPLALLTVAAFALVVGRGHGPPLGLAATEEFGPLMQQIERERRAGDRILLYRRSHFVWGYYRTATPVLVPNPNLANGYTVRLDDPEVIPVHTDDVDGPVARAIEGAGRVWFVGSRFQPGDELRIRAALAKRGRIVREERRSGALLVLLESR